MTVEVEGQADIAPEDGAEDTPNVENERPEWLPEKFWVDNAPAYDQLAKSYGELEKMRGSMKEKISEELQSERLAARPETPNDYKLPENEALDTDAMGNSPLVSWWREFSHENGYSQEQFETALNTYAETQIQQVQAAYDQEFKKLGDNAKARVEAVTLWANNTFNEAQMEAISAACTSAAGVEAMETIMNALKGSPGFDPSVFEKKPEMSKAEAERMMQDRRYWHPAERDPAFVKKVEDFFSKSYQG